MKRILFILALICLQKSLHAQQPYIYTIKADSVKITNTCDTAELIIENHTQNVPGFLFNKGRGRTEFRRGLLKITDSIYMVGGDTLRMNPWLQGGNRFGSTGNIGTLDNNHMDFYSNGMFRGRLSNNGNLLWGTTAEDGRWKMEVENGSVGAIKAKNRLDVYSPSSTQGVSVVISNANFGPHLTLGVAGGYYAWSTYAVPTDAVISTRSYHRLILSSGVVILQSNTLIGTNVDDGNKLQVNGTGIFADTLKLPNIRSKTDTATCKPVVADANGNLFKMSGWPATTTPALTVVNGSTTDITAAVGSLTKLPDMAGVGSHSVTLPTASSYAGQKIYIWNMNSSGNSWTFSSSVTLPDGSTSNSIPNQSTIELLSDGSIWIKWK